MSRIGRQPINIPEGVEVNIDAGRIEVKGPKGELSGKLIKNMEVTIQDGVIEVKPKITTPDTQKQFGLQRTLIANMVIGVSEGFSKELEVNGVGFRAQMKGSELEMTLGFSHPINYTPPEGVVLSVNQNIINVSGIDKQVVGEAAANIRDFKKPEPYKGKGIRYVDEYVRRKAGKAAGKGAAE